MNHYTDTTTPILYIPPTGYIPARWSWRAIWIFVKFALQYNLEEALGTGQLC